MRKKNNNNNFTWLTTSDKIYYVINYVILALLLIIIAYPLYFVIIASVSNPSAVALGKVWFLPEDISFEGYAHIFKDSDIWIGYRNTVFYTAFGTIINLAVTLPAGYALSRKELWNRNKIMGIFSFTMFFSGGMIPTYLIIKKLNILDTLWAMILPNALNVYNMILARTFFASSIPDELRDAAQIDGCDDFKYFFFHVIPLSSALIAVMTLYYAVGHWNAFFNALIYLTSRSKYPLQLILREILIGNSMLTETVTDSAVINNAIERGEMMKYGAIIVSTLPVMIFYPFIQKYFNKGVMLGAVKG